MSKEQSIFDALPGEQMPVSEVMNTLSNMWQVSYQESQDAPSGFRASQMNLVIHFGMQATAEEALRIFDTAIEFAQRYPCRIIVLCPQGREFSDALLEAKLFSQCYIGETMRDMCCCEALMLGYPTRVAGFLDNQVSIWLESDLPTYHWFFRVPAQRIEEIHLEFVGRCRRAIYDSTIEGDAYAAIPWEQPQAIRDLAFARLLPLRQSLGQFFSSFQPASLVTGLEEVSVHHSDCRSGEADNLAKWLERCLADCAQQAGVDFKAKFRVVRGCAKSSNCLESTWTFAQQQKQFAWVFCAASQSSVIHADFGDGKIEVPLQVHFLSDEKALAEALFFA